MVRVVVVRVVRAEVVMVEVTEVAVGVAATAEAMMVEVRAVVVRAMCAAEAWTPFDSVMTPARPFARLLPIRAFDDEMQTRCFGTTDASNLFPGARCFLSASNPARKEPCRVEATCRVEANTGTTLAVGRSCLA